MNAYDHHKAFRERQESITAITSGAFRDYDHFARSVPISKQISPVVAVQTADARPFSPSLLSATSGTTGNMKPVRILLKMGGDSISTSERNFVYRLRKRKVISPQDVVGNLFTINLFSSLHNSASEIIKYCQASVVPVGDISLLKHAHFLFLKDAGLNVLFGVPATVIQFVEAMLAAAVPLAINKIVYTGEGLRQSHESYLKNALGESISITGLYGLSECGFLGLSATNHNDYILFSDDFFFEYDEHYGLLVTTLDPTTKNRLIRYPTGDDVELKRHENQLLMRIITRKDLAFNYMGNLISFASIRSEVTKIVPDSQIQLLLQSDEYQHDRLVVKTSGSNISSLQLRQIAQLLRKRPELAEAYSKQRGTVEVVKVAECDFILSARGKHQLIVDERK